MNKSQSPTWLTRIRPWAITLTALAIAVDLYVVVVLFKPVVRLICPSWVLFEFMSFVCAVLTGIIHIAAWAEVITQLDKKYDVYPR